MFRLGEVRIHKDEVTLGFDRQLEFQAPTSWRQIRQEQEQARDKKL